jgi:hypothetical protein
MNKPMDESKKKKLLDSFKIKGCPKCKKDTIKTTEFWSNMVRYQSCSNCDHQEWVQITNEKI